MSKLDLDDKHVYVTDITVSEARALLDILLDPTNDITLADVPPLPDDLTSELDKAQGDVWAKVTDRSYFVIRITSP